MVDGDGRWRCLLQVGVGGDGFGVENWEKQMEIRGGISWDQF